MVIHTLERGNYAVFREMFTEYYGELGCDDDCLHLLDEYILPDYEAGLLHIALHGDDGFIIYQTDDPVNDWCFKDGCGDIREVFVRRGARRRKVGSSLVRFAEQALAAEGADGVYTLPTEDSEQFFAALDYADSGEYCEELDNKVFIKE